MSIQAVLFVAVVSTAAVPELPMHAHDPVGLAFEHDRNMRLAQGKADKSVPGALPGRSESSQEGPSTRAPRKSKKPAAEKETKDKEAPSKDGKKDPQ